MALYWLNEPSALRLDLGLGLTNHMPTLPRVANGVGFLFG